MPQRTKAFSDDVTVEVAGNFATRESFTATVEALTAAGFEHDDISVLDTHESLSAAGKPSDAWRESLAGLVGSRRGPDAPGLAVPESGIPAIVIVVWAMDFLSAEIRKRYT